MSDTSGVSGLDNDMPGLGPASGNVRGPPSQLQSLVQRFSQQSRPNPKFLPPAPTPGGQSQGKPQLGSTDPPDPTVQRIAPVPANAPRPPPRFDPYIPPTPRDSSQWGQPEPFARQPASFELPGLYQQLGSYFAQSGGFIGGPTAIGMAAYAAEYQDAFQKGRQEKMRMSLEQLKLHSAQLEDIETSQNIEMGDIFTMYDEKGPGETINGESLHDALWRNATEHGNKNVMAMLEDGQSAEKVRRYLADHEAHIRALSAANKKTTEEDAAAELYGLKPGGGESNAYDPITNPTGVHAGTTPAASPAPASAPSADKDARAPGAEQDPLSPDKDKGEDADEIEDPHKKRLHGAAVEVLKGNEPKDIPKDVLPYAGIAARELRQKVDNIIKDAKAGKIAPERVLPEIRKQVGGDVANDVQDVLDYRQPAAGQGSGAAGKEGDYKAMLGHVAAAIDPGNPAEGKGGWSAQNYQAREAFKTNVNTQTVIIRSNSLAADGKAVLADLKELERQGVPTNEINLEALYKFPARYPQYAKLAGDWYAYNAAFNTIVTGGRHTETGEQRQESVAPVSYASPAAFRAAMKGHMNDAIGYLEGEHRRWETIGGKPWDMPSSNPKTEKELRDIRDMDYLTGTLPGEPFTNKKGVTKTWKGGNLNPYDTGNWE